MPFSPLPPLRDTGRRIRGRPLYTLLDGLHFNLGFGDHGGGVRVMIPAGSETDLASAPWLVRWLLQLDGENRRLAIMHDFLYGLPGCSRFLADSLLRAGMEDARISRWRRLLVYYAVRVFGRSHYRKGA